MPLSRPDPVLRTTPALPAMVLAAATLAAPAAAAGSTVQWQGELALASAITDRGLLVGPDRPALQAQLAGSLPGAAGSGWSAGLAASVQGRDGRHRRRLVWLSTYRPLDNDWQAGAVLGDYAYPGGDAGARAFDRSEAGVHLAWRDLFTAGVTAIHYPAWPGRRAGLQWAFDIGARWPLGGPWSLTASLGRADMPPLPERRYTYGGLGLAWESGDWRLQLDHLGTDAAARRRLGESARARWSVLAVRNF